MNLIGQGPRIVLHPSSATLTVMARTYRLSPWPRAVNGLIRVLLSIGLGRPAPTCSPFVAQEVASGKEGDRCRSHCSKSPYQLSSSSVSAR